MKHIIYFYGYESDIEKNQLRELFVKYGYIPVFLKGDKKLRNNDCIIMNYCDYLINFPIDYTRSYDVARYGEYFDIVLPKFFEGTDKPQSSIYMTYRDRDGIVNAESFIYIEPTELFKGHYRHVNVSIKWK